VGGGTEDEMMLEWRGYTTVRAVSILQRNAML
jgi:hypothetical protein